MFRKPRGDATKAFGRRPAHDGVAILKAVEEGVDDILHLLGNKPIVTFLFFLARRLLTPPSPYPTTSPSPPGLGGGRGGCSGLEVVEE